MSCITILKLESKKLYIQGYLRNFVLESVVVFSPLRRFKMHSTFSAKDMCNVVGFVASPGCGLLAPSTPSRRHVVPIIMVAVPICAEETRNQACMLGETQHVAAEIF
jgi:hypothetical protein